MFCQGKTKQKTTRKPKAEAAFLFCFSALPFRGRGKSKTKPLPASRKNGKESVGRDGVRKPWGKDPKIPRRGRRVTLCHKRRGEVNGPRAGKASRLGRVGRYVPSGPRFLPEAPSKAGRGKEQGCKADFLSTRKKFSTAKRRRRCPQSNRNLHTRRCAAG